MAAKTGQFVWYDLMTTDVDAAKAFYTETIGWKTIPFEGGPTPYTMWAIGEQPIGGVMKLPAEMKGVPPHWTAFVAVDDVDAFANKAKELGGKILNPGTDIPTVGRFGVIADPQGAAICLFKPLKEMTALDGHSKPGEFGWHELNTTDWEGAWTFYSKLFGWKESMKMDMGPEHGTYFIFNDNNSEQGVGGMSSMAKKLKVPAHWLYYTTVDNIDNAVERIKKNGGKVLNGPMDVPGGDKVAQCQDPQGGMFAIHWRNPQQN